MPADQTIQEITGAATWDERIAKIRLVPQRHGTDEHAAIYAEVARQIYVPHLAPDYAYIHRSDFYEPAHFAAAYELAATATSNFAHVDADALATIIRAEPTTLIVFRNITGLAKTEFAASTSLVAAPLGLAPLSVQKVDSMEKNGSAISADQARVAALTITEIIAGTLFGEPTGTLKTKQDKPDTADGWTTVREFATEGVPYGVFLHQRHYGGSFRQVLDATSTLRGDLIEDAVEELFTAHGIPFIRTGSHNQAEIERRFEVAVRPAPDFVVFDSTDTLRAMLECKGANDGGTARDKALRLLDCGRSPFGLGASRSSPSSAVWAGHASTTHWGR